MKLDPQWQQAYKWFSVHALAIAGTLPATWESLPHRWQDTVPFSYVALATAITSVLGIAGRLFQQPSAKPQEKHEC